MLLRVSLVILLVGINCMLTFGEETVFANNNNISAPGDDCSSALCDPESEMCDNDSRICVCKETHVEVHGKCLKKAVYLGDDCIDDKQCKDFGEHSICYKIGEDEAACICDPGKSFANDDFSKCIPFAEKLGDPCTEDIQCQIAKPGEHSYCEKETGAEEGKCSCSEGATNEPGENKCLKLPIMLGDECEIDFQCITAFGNMAQCYDKMCDCMLGIGVPNQQKNKCMFIVNRLRDNCIEHIQCREGEPGDFSICYRKSESDSETVCQCNSVTVNVPGNNKCLRIAQIIGEECEDDIQCSHLICDDGWSNSTCIKENCEETSKCRCIDAPVPLNYKDTVGLRNLPGLYAKQPKRVQNSLMEGKRVVKKQNSANAFPVINLN